MSWISEVQLEEEMLLKACAEQLSGGEQSCNSPAVLRGASIIK